MFTQPIKKVLIHPPPKKCILFQMCLIAVLVVYKRYSVWGFGQVSGVYKNRHIWNSALFQGRALLCGILISQGHTPKIHVLAASFSHGKNCDWLMWTRFNLSSYEQFNSADHWGWFLLSVLNKLWSYRLSNLSNGWNNCWKCQCKALFIQYTNICNKITPFSRICWDLTCIWKEFIVCVQSWQHKNGRTEQCLAH